ncbi:hypothetical protein EOE18_12250 [Novosphingobium umbonatum]|uniref:O-antigen ligase domain-containing protein n=1 Tax=Novosphingobium umbonatum TaxID=1908524 RepID=A0A437N2V6_9SPHN|nr:hypothetical protein [Novosphingobium umbonatum]RVU04262.1 hypothetical protein EOE18_12250 [Novosphingobium umbonatum]
MSLMLHPAEVTRQNKLAQTPVLTMGKLEITCLLLTLLIEVGTSYWLSFATLTALLMLFRYGKVFAKGLSDVPAFLFIMPLMYTPLLWERSVDPNQDILKISREILFYTLSVSFFLGVRHFAIAPNSKAVTRTIRIIAIFLFCLCIVQMGTLSRGIYFGIPADLYAQGNNTVPTELTLRFMHLRPAATFTEPSYLAFEVLGLLMINGFFHHLGGRDPFANILLVATGLMSQSLSFVLFLGVLVSVAVMTMPAFARYRIACLVVGMIIGLGIMAASDDLFITKRLSTAGQANGDFSIFVRIFGPAGVMGDFLASYPLGALSTAMIDAITPLSARAGMPPNEYLMNSIYNALFYYGIFGPFLLYFFFRPFNKMYKLYVFLSFIFNGNCFAPDKFTCFALFYVLYIANGYGAASYGARPQAALPKWRRWQGKNPMPLS